MKPVLVCGLEPLGIAVIRQLVAKGVPAQALAAPHEAASYAHELKRLGVPVCIGVSRSAGELEAAGLHAAAAVVLTADDDAENVDAALTARRLRPGVPIIARVFDPSLGQYLEETENGLTVMSVSGLVSPRFAQLALSAASEAPREAPAAARRPTSDGDGQQRRRVDPIVIRLAVVTAIVVLLSVAFFSKVLAVSWFHALYFVIESITNTGYNDVPIRDAGFWSMTLAIVLMIGGAALVALVYALITEWFITRRQEVLQGRVPEKGSGHVVIAGAGNVGFRVAQLLAIAGRKVVVIEKDGESRNAAQLRADGRHVIVADAGLEETLDLAGVRRSAVVMALTDSDAVNLKVALAVRARELDVPVVVRLISPELSGHLHGRRAISTVSPIAVASEHFAEAAVAVAAGTVIP